jgi:hypothetical protein
MSRYWTNGTLFFLALLLGQVNALAETPKEAVGFFGNVTGVVKSAKEDGTSFMVTVSSAEPDEHSAVKEAAPMVGKVLTLGTRMPRAKDGTPGPHVDDVAFIKSLKPGMTVTVKIFAVKSDPRVLRIILPGKIETPAAK